MQCRELTDWQDKDIKRWNITLILYLNFYKILAPHTLSVNLQFNNITDYQTWLNFYENSINHGCDWFIAPILNDRLETTDPIIARKVRIQNGQITESLNCRNSIGACYKISMTLDVDNVEFDQSWSDYYA